MKKQICFVMAAMMAAGMLAGCDRSAKEITAAATEATTTAAETTAEETTAKETIAASGEETEILVAAAASLKNAYEDKLIPMFEEANPGVTVKGTYAQANYRHRSRKVWMQTYLCQQLKSR